MQVHLINNIKEIAIIASNAYWDFQIIDGHEPGMLVVHLGLRGLLVVRDIGRLLSNRVLFIITYKCRG